MRLKLPSLLATVAVALLASACRDAGVPLAPEVLALAPRTAAAADNSSGSGVFVFEEISYLDCLGEEVRNQIEMPYTYRLHVNANGEYVYVETWDKALDGGTLTGLTSGHVWTRTDQVSPFIDRSTGGGMTHYTFRGRFVSETAPTIEVRAVMHIGRDANGVLRVDRWQQKCWLQ